MADEIIVAVEEILEDCVILCTEEYWIERASARRRLLNNLIFLTTLFFIMAVVCGVIYVVIALIGWVFGPFPWGSVTIYGFFRIGVESITILLLAILFPIAVGVWIFMVFGN